jgi:hypothetical protein
VFDGYAGEFIEVSPVAVFATKFLSLCPTRLSANAANTFFASGEILAACSIETAKNCSEVRQSSEHQGG